MTEKIKEMINDHYLDLLIDERLNESPYEIRIKKGFDTASWCYRDAKNFIVVGEDIMKSTKKPIDECHEYIGSYLYHEVSHSLSTERELSLISKACRAQKVPYGLWNSAEDARIEHLMRKDTKRAFNWAKYEESKSDGTPRSRLFYVIQNDGDASGLKDDEVSKKVVSFYERFINAKDSWEIIDICVEWVKEFKKNESQENNKKQAGKDNKQDKKSSTQENAKEVTQDLELSVKLAEMSEKEFEQFFADTVCAITTSDDAQEVEEAMSGQGELNSVSIAEYSSGKLLSEIEESWDIQKAKELSSKLSKAFQEKKGYRTSKRTAKKMNKKAFRPGSVTTKFYREKITQRTAKKTVSLVVDCSGSMHRVINEMKIVLGVFNILAQTGKINGNIILSGVIGHQGRAVYETFKMPVKENVVSKISAVYSNEGLNGALNSTKNLLKSSDYVFVLTDGMITDEPVDKRELHLSGVYTTGIYIGNRNVDLSKWFDKSITTESVESCAEELVLILSK